MYVTEDYVSVTPSIQVENKRYIPLTPNLIDLLNWWENVSIINRFGPKFGSKQTGVSGRELVSRYNTETHL